MTTMQKTPKNDPFYRTPEELATRERRRKLLRIIKMYANEKQYSEAIQNSSPIQFFGMPPAVARRIIKDKDAVHVLDLSPRDASTDAVLQFASKYGGTVGGIFTDGYEGISLQKIAATYAIFPEDAGPAIERAISEPCSSVKKGMCNPRMETRTSKVGSKKIIIASWGPD